MTQVLLKEVKRDHKVIRWSCCHSFFLAAVEEVLAESPQPEGASPAAAAHHLVSCMQVDALIVASHRQLPAQPLQERNVFVLQA